VLCDGDGAGVAIQNRFAAGRFHNGGRLGPAGPARGGRRSDARRGTGPHRCRVRGRPLHQQFFGRRDLRARAASVCGRNRAAAGAANRRPVCNSSRIFRCRELYRR
jgi:hypothetical protein